MGTRSFFLIMNRFRYSFSNKNGKLNFIFDINNSSKYECCQ